MMKGFKIRIYPTKEQEQKIWRHIGACRFIWNYMLELQQERYKLGEKHLSGFEMIKLITPLKKIDEFAWLKNISTISLQRTCSILAEDYNNFFKKHSGFPKFKSRKKSKPSYPVRTDKFYFDNNTVQIEKLGKIKYKSDFYFPQGRNEKFYNVRVSYVLGKYMLSFAMECENQALTLNEYSMGIDLGIKELAVVAYNDQKLAFGNINKSKKVRVLKQNLKHLQRAISRKYEASRKRTGRYEKTKNIIRDENKLRKLYARITNIRSNYLHQTTASLIAFLPKRVVMEDLKVVGITKNKHLNKAIQEQCFSDFIRKMRYKCELNGIEFVTADRFYPSSKTCSRCGSVKHDLKLSDRTYVCCECGLKIDRDYNAAINLMRYVDLQTQATA